MERKIKKRVLGGIVFGMIIVITAGYVYYISKIQRQPIVEQAVPEVFRENVVSDKPFVSPVSHPGKIIIRSLIDGGVKEVNADEAPIEGKFIFFKEGKEVSYTDNFDEVIPIVEVEITKDKKIKQYGEGHRLLRAITLDSGNQADPASTPPSGTLSK